MKTKYVKILIKSTLVPALLLLPCWPVFSQEDNSEKKSAKILDNRISIDLKDVPLKSALSTIATEGKVRINYREDILPAGMKVSIIADNMPVGEVLNEVIQGTVIEVVVINDDQLVLVKSEKKKQAPSGMLEGRVTEKETGKPIPGANVILAGTDYGAATDTTGRYIIGNLPPGTYNVRVMVIGYNQGRVSVVVSIWDTTRQDFALEVEPIPMEGIEAEAPRAELEKEIQISVQELRGPELQLAGSTAQADLFRTIQTLPAVAQASDFSSELYIRGGSPDQNLVLLDGATVYNPFHFIGFFGAFNSLGVESAKLYAGGYPARYGGRASSVLDIRNKVGNKEAYHGALNIDFLSASGLVEGPIPGGSFSFSGRRSFQRYMETLNRSGVYGSKIPPYRFYDFQGKTVTQITPSHRLILSGYWADDFMEGYRETRKPYVQEDFQESMSIGGFAYDLTKKVGQLFSYRSVFGLDVDWGNRAGSVTWQYLPGDNLTASFTYAGSRFHSNLHETDNTMYPSSFRLMETINDRTLQTELIWSPLKRVQFRAGAQYKQVGINYSLSSPQEALLPMLFPIDPDHIQIQTERRMQDLSTYIETSVDLTDNLLVNAGLRMTKYETLNSSIPDIYSFNFLKYSHEVRFFESASYWNLEPRLGMKYNPDDNNYFKFAWGVYNQNLFLIPLLSGSNVTILNLWFPLDGKYNSVKANHYILGYKRYLPEGFSLTAEFYYKQLNHFMEQSDTYVANEPDSFFKTGKGRIKGMELLIRRQGKNTYGWIGYSLSHGSFKSTGEVYDLWFDQRHRINFVLHWFSHDRKWESTWSWTYNSGLPYTKIIADGLALNLEGTNEPAGVQGYDYLPVNINGQKHAWRYQAYHRMDLSIKRMLMEKPFKLLASLWVVNLYNSHNVFFYRYQGAYTHANEIGMLPNIPFLGLEAKF